MEAKELRVGNLMRYRISNKYDWEIMPVHSLYKNGRIEVGHTKQKINITGEPIPLTDEWLVRLGFKEVHYGCWELYYCESDFLVFTQEDAVVIDLNQGQEYSGVSVGNIKHVHQLQNLFFALTGEELERKGI